MKKSLVMTCNRLIVDFNEILESFADPRVKNKITYDFVGKIWAVILQCLGISASARDWDNEKYNVVPRENINQQSECSFTHLPHSDTFKYLLEKVNPYEINKILVHWVTPDDIF